MTFLLPNGKPIDTDMLGAAMEDSDRCHSYYFNRQTGDVIGFSDDDEHSDEHEQQMEEIEGTDHYVSVDRISFHEAYQWMEDFLAEAVAANDERLAEKLSIALRGKGAFRRFRDVLREGDEKWVQAWYQWKDDHLHAAMKRWFEELELTLTEE